MLGEIEMSGGCVRQRNDWSLAMIFETLKNDGVQNATEVAAHLLRPIPIWLIVYLLRQLLKMNMVLPKCEGIAYIVKLSVTRWKVSSISPKLPIHTTTWMLKRIVMVDQTAAVVRATQLGF